jgi:hypothetical protein
MTTNGCTLKRQSRNAGGLDAWVPLNLSCRGTIAPIIN